MTATVSAASARKVTPPTVVSARAAPAWLPTSRLASRAAGASSQPERGTPRWAYPGRPTSWTVVSGPASSTVSARLTWLTRRPRRTARACRASEGGLVAVGVPQARVGATDQPPAAGRGGRVDPGVFPRQPHGPGRHPGAGPVGPRGTASSGGRPVQ